MVDLSTMEVNDDLSTAAEKLKEEVQSLQKTLKKDIKDRKELEDSVVDLFEKLKSRFSFDVNKQTKLNFNIFKKKKKKSTPNEVGPTRITKQGTHHPCN